ncbi:MAG: hypothetical protein ACI9SB_001491 [Candidatus Azotimanducaceae bacterium]|jgi:hypothetical protein
MPGDIDKRPPADPYADLRSSLESDSEPHTELDVSDERQVQEVERREQGCDRRDTRRVDVESSPRWEKPERRHP